MSRAPRTYKQIMEDYYRPTLRRGIRRGEYDSETVEKLAAFFKLARIVASLGDMIGEQIEAWAESDFDPNCEEITGGALGYIRDRFGTWQCRKLAELLDVESEEVEKILR